MRNKNEFFMDQLKCVNHEINKLSNAAINSLNIKLNYDQWRLLHALSAHPNISQIDLSKKLNRDPASLKRSLDILDNKGLTYRKLLDSDQKKNKVQLTIKAEQLLNEYTYRIDSKISNCFNGFFDQERELMVQFLERIKKNIQDLDY